MLLGISACTFEIIIITDRVYTQFVKRQSFFFCNFKHYISIINVNIIYFF
mgnify:CR=1 FL=1